MTDRYRVSRSLGGGYTVRQSDFIEDGMLGAVGIAGSIIGGSIDVLVATARNSRDRRMAQEIQEMDAVSNSDQFERLLVLSTKFTQRYPQQFYGPMFTSWALLGSARYDEAINAANRAANLGLSSADVAALRLIIFEQKGDLGRAVNECTILMQHNETRHEAYLYRAQALMRIGDLDLALSDANTALSIIPDEAGYVLRGDIHCENGDLSAAIEDYTRAIRLQPTSAVAFNKRAGLYDRLGRSEEARADRATAVSAIHQNSELKEAREFLNYLRSNGVNLTISANGRDIEFGNSRLKRDTINRMKGLKSDLIRLLSRE